MITKLKSDFKLKIILMFLQVFGINIILRYTGNNRYSKNINPYLLAWNTILIAFSIVLIAIVHIERRHIFFVEHAIGQFTDMLQFLGPAISMVVLLFELHFNKRRHVLIRNNLNQIYDIIQLPANLFDTIINHLFIKWIILFVLTLAVEIYIMVNITCERNWSLLWYTTIGPKVMIRLGLLYYVTYVDFITGALQTINDILLNNQIQLGMLDVSQKLRRVRESANILWNTVRLLNTAFGWFQLFFIVQLLFTLTCDLYWVVGALLDKPHPYFLSSILCNVSPIASILILFNSTENLKKQGTQLIPNLMKLHKSKFNEKLKGFILRFAYQMSLSAYYCDVYGFFTLDYICLRNLIAAICTYISIFRSLSQS